MPCTDPAVSRLPRAVARGLGIALAVHVAVAAAQPAAPRSPAETARLLADLQSVPMPQSDQDECSRRQAQARAAAVSVPAKDERSAAGKRLGELGAKIDGKLGGVLGGLFGAAKPSAPNQDTRPPEPAASSDTSVLDNCVVDAKLRLKQQAAQRSADASAWTDWPQELLPFERAKALLPPDLRSIAGKPGQDPYVFTNGASATIVFGKTVLTGQLDPSNPNCLNIGPVVYLRFNTSVEPSASCPRLADTRRLEQVARGRPEAELDPPSSPIAAKAPPEKRVATAPGSPPTAAADGLLHLDYVGEALSHRSGQLAIPTSIVNVRVSIVVVDGALRANDELRGSSGLPGDREFVKSVVVTDGDQTYDFDNRQHVIEILLRTDALRRIVGWRIRAALRTDNGSRYIRIFGPGFERDREIDPLAFGAQVAGAECLGQATDISFSRGGYDSAGAQDTRFLAQSCRAGRWATAGNPGPERQAVQGQR